MRVFLPFLLALVMANADQNEFARRMNALAKEAEPVPSQSEIDACLRDLQHADAKVASRAVDRLRSFVIRGSVDRSKLLPAVPVLTTIFADNARPSGARNNALLVWSLLTDDFDRKVVDALKTLVDNHDIQSRHLAILRLARAEAFRDEVAEFFRLKLLDPQASEYWNSIQRAIDLMGAGHP